MIAVELLQREADSLRGYDPQDRRGKRLAQVNVEIAQLSRPPLVVGLMTGGLVQGEIVVSGTGTPEFIVLDFDREGADLDELQGFLETIIETRGKLQARGIDLSDDWMDEVAKIATAAAEAKVEDDAGYEDGPPPDLNPEGDPTRNGAFG